MAIIGISLILASVVWVIVRPPGWLPPWFARWTPSFRRAIEGPKDESRNGDVPLQTKENGTTTAIEKPDFESALKRKSDKNSMPPPPAPPSPPSSSPPPPTNKTPTIQPPTPEEPEEQITPKATITNPSQPIPSFSLNNPSSSKSPSRLAPQISMLPPPRPSGRLPPPTTNGLTSTPSPTRLPQFPAANSTQRARGPQPNRGPGCSTLPGLAPPPTHSSKPSKPSRAVVLTPGHSPLDWARISHPSADLRGLPASTPYLRVTPSMLKKQTGRKGTDAWMGLSGKVYNISPYADFHPGGVPELMRGAGKDGTRLFGEIHPWVNYETMLQACLVGLLVEEPVEGQVSEMDQMD